MNQTNRRTNTSNSFEKRSLEELISAADRLPQVEAELDDRNKELADLRDVRTRLERTEQQLGSARAAFDKERETRALELEAHRADQAGLRVQLEDSERRRDRLQERVKEEQHLRERADAALAEVTKTNRELHAELNKPAKPDNRTAALAQRIESLLAEQAQTYEQLAESERDVERHIEQANGKGHLLAEAEDRLHDTRLRLADSQTAASDLRLKLVDGERQHAATRDWIKKILPCLTEYARDLDQVAQLTMVATNSKTTLQETAQRIRDFVEACPLSNGSSNAPKAS